MKFITAIKTPYTKKGRIDLNAFSKLVQRQIDANMDGIVVSGTTGEGHLMNWPEQIMLIRHAVNNFGKDIKIIANVGANCTNEAIRATDNCFGLGIDYALQINPYYGKVCDRGMFKHLSTLMEFGPTILYNVPSRTGQDIPVHVVNALSKHSNFAGIKECHSADRSMHHLQNGINVWSGNDDEAPDLFKHGAGVISVASNIVPEFTKNLGSATSEDLEKNQILFDWLFKYPNPIGVNTAMAMMGLCQPVFRMPYLPLERKEREEGKRILEEHFGLDNVNVLNDPDFVIRDKF